MGTPLKNAPIVCVIAQVLHDPIPKFSDFEESIHECMKRAGLPGLEKAFDFSVKIPTALGGGVNSERPLVENLFRLIFTNTSLDKVFIVEKQSITYITSYYVNFETFQKEFSDLVAAYLDVIKLEYIERVGVRYVDVFEPIVPNAPISSVVQGVLGLSETLTNETPMLYTTTECRLILSKTDHVISRTTLQLSEFKLPGGIGLPFLKIQEKFLKINGVHATIDTDAFSEGRVPFEHSYLINKVDELHKGAAMAFRATVTPGAIEAWS